MGGRLSEAAKPHRIFTPPFPTAKLRPSITPTRRVDNRPTGDCAFAPRRACRRPPACDLPSPLGRIGQPNQTLAKSGSGWSSLNLVSISARIGVHLTSFLVGTARGRGARKKKCWKNCHRLTPGWTACFVVSVGLIFFIYPPFVLLLYYCTNFIFLGFGGAAQRDRLVAVASGGMG
ncbi:hypothetical protein B0T18DRAFT_418075 [Schizothecium vesticola]|uniref:Uncharacterized protein n=1 Tax=Schizothecium vesticola TaxID=314040 RepID=A0AA40EJH6_9PEZI|nr:hypothetical protein B0T18DRAFT_418075 [Schizothecium vesticola]